MARREGHWWKKDWLTEKGIGGKKRLARRKGHFGKQKDWLVETGIVEKRIGLIKKGIVDNKNVRSWKRA